jgi:hypothetical protein
LAVRIILLIVVAIAMVGIFGNLTSQGGMSNAIQGFHVSVATIAYSSEFNEIRLITDDFMQLRAMGSSDEAKEFAEKLDKRINNLRLVKTYCDQAISTFELSLNTNPYEKLQKLCPALEDVSFSKALQLFSLI